MSSPISIPGSSPHIVSASISPSTLTIHDRFANTRRQDSGAIRQPKVLHPVDNEGLRLLILENISQEAVELFRAQGYYVDHYTKAMSEDELVEKIGSYHGIGIRSKTKITARVLKVASKVLATCVFYSDRLLKSAVFFLASCHRMLLHRY